MSTVTWTGNAHSVKQISTITIANTWAAADTCTITINGKDLVVTCGSTTTTTALVATAIKEAWMASGRLDGTSSSSDATSNFGGQDFGEFRELVATVSGSVVTLTAVTAGKPITLAVAENTAGTGTATLATSQTATGKHHWDNGDNWDGGSVPANDDTVVFRDSDISCKYGLPNGSKEVTIQQWRSYTGEVGLPAINRDDPSYPYVEYRQRYVRLDDAGTGADIAHRFGLGQDGSGCRLFNLKHSTVKCSPVVYHTAQPLAERIGTKALNICCTANTSTINVLSGSVDFSSQDSGVSAYEIVTIAGGDCRCVGGGIHTGVSTVVTISGGTITVGQSGAINTIFVRGGILRLENQTGTIAGLNAFGGVVDYASAATITTLTVSGTFDARGDAGGFTVVTASLYRGAKFYDPYQRMSPGTMTLYYDPSPDVQFGADYGAGVTVDY